VCNICICESFRLNTANSTGAAGYWTVFWWCRTRHRAVVGQAEQLKIKLQLQQVDWDRFRRQQATEHRCRAGAATRNIAHQLHGDAGHEHRKRSVCPAGFVDTCIFFVAAVEKAIKHMNNRYFTGRRIQTDVYDQNAFDADDLSGGTIASTTLVW